MSDNFKCYILMFYMHSFFQRSLFLFLIFLDIIFTLVYVVFLNPFMDFDSVFKLLEYASTCMMGVPDNMDTGLVSLLFSAISISIFNNFKYYFYTSF